jgi:transcriptional regulator of heat shock response
MSAKNIIGIGWHSLLTSAKNTQKSLKNRMELDLKQQRILAAIVKEYSETASPVGSKELVSKYRLNVSPATIRGIMASLEKSGYIYQPHKSAGRIPTDQGYRFFVNELMHRFELSEKERRMLKQELIRLKIAHEQMGRSIANLISSMSGQAAFALLPQDTSALGLSKIVNEPEFTDPATLKGITELFDNLDRHAGKLMTGSGEEVSTFIGKESPLPVPKNMSLILSKVKMKNGKKGIIGIVGPKRMAYAKNVSLLQYLSKLLSGSAVIFLIFT